MMPKYTLKRKTAAPRPDRFAWTDEEAEDLFGVEVSEKRYNPSQPRFPAGHPQGGQWAPAGGGLSISFLDPRGKEFVVDPNSSLYPHLERQPDGSYKISAERQALHARIVEDSLSDSSAVANPAMYMTGGGPASGKSTMLESELIKGFPANAVHVNADHFKEQLPDYHSKLVTDRRSAAAFVHQESSMLGDRVRDAARANRRNIVYDTTGNSSYETLKGKIDRFRADGYPVHAHYASLDTDLAVKIAYARGEKTGRYVPESVVRDTHASVSRTLDRAMRENLFDTVSLYDTNVHRQPRLVAAGTRSSFEIHNRPLYDDFVRKATRARKSDATNHLTTHDVENILTEVLLGVTDSQFKSAEADVLREKIKADLEALPDGAEVMIGNEYPDRDYGFMYDESREGGTDEVTMRSAPEHDGEGVLNEQYVAIKKADDEKQIVYGEVYAPGVLDTYGEFMTAKDIEIMAHRFMQIDLRTAIDTNHDNVPNGAYPIESFVAREGDPDYTPGAWVLGVKIPQPELWRKVKTGELNGFSFQSLVKPTSVEVEYDVIRDHVGKTESQADHDHIYLVELDEIGNVVRGVTSPAADGHFHEITRASHTENTEGHNHRFFL